MKQICVALSVFLALAAQATAESRDNALIAAAIAQTEHQVTYDGSYQRIAYPRGDIPENLGVCTDVVIRAYRAIGVDLQSLINEDMQRQFSAYPKLWGMQTPDANIDHRRVPNLQTYLNRQHAELPISSSASDYKAGDLVTWMLPGNLPHIGIVVDRRSADRLRPLVVHNIGRGPQLEDMLFSYRLTGHYRFVPIN